MMICFFREPPQTVSLNRVGVREVNSSPTLSSRADRFASHQRVTKEREKKSKHNRLNGAE